MRIGLITSVAAHVVFVVWIILLFARLPALPPSESISVELIPPKETAEASKAEPGGGRAPAPQQHAEPILMPHWWPDNWVAPGAAGAPANSVANLSPEEIAALHAHLQKCWSLRAAIPAGQKLRVTMRVTLGPDGALLTEPTLLQASASPHGPAVVGAALSALNRCQPIAVLPANKYEQWKVLDLTFTPQGLTSG